MLLGLSLAPDIRYLSLIFRGKKRMIAYQLQVQQPVTPAVESVGLMVGGLNALVVALPEGFSGREARGRVADDNDLSFEADFLFLIGETS
jgi:hypothetical protein